MEKLFEQIYDELQSAWRFRWVALIAAVVIAIASWAVVFALPDRFEAGARVFVDTRTALKPILQGLTVEQDVNAQLNFVRQSLLAGKQLQKIAEDAGVLSPAVTRPAEQAEILIGMASRIELTVTSASGRENDGDIAGRIYGISYRDSNRERTLKVVEVLLNTLMEQTLGGKRAGSENAQKFLETQIADYERRLRIAEDRLADFKKRNIGLMPTEQGGYFAQLQNEIDAAKKAETDLSIAISRRGELERQLRGEAVVNSAGSTPVIGVSGIASGSDTLSRIKDTQARLDELLLRFTDKHPDVIAARETLEELKKRRQAEIESVRRGDPNAVAASGASSNPVFQSIQLALNQADVEIASLRGQLAQHRGKATELRQRLDTAPRVEAEFAQLNRDYDVNKTQYTALLANYEKARLGEQADNAGSVRFEIVQPPNVSFGPVFPRRSMLLAGALAMALAVGAGLAYLLHLFNPVVGSLNGLAEYTGRPVLGVVGPAFPGRMRAEAVRNAWRFAAAVGTTFVALIGVLALNWSGFRIHLHSIAGMG
jgi:polysaccharide chain length determinant protein (PEP-CTERM system associated)